MKRKLFLTSLMAVLAFAFVAIAQTSTFTYQGSLTDASLPATGTYEMQFSIWDAVTLGTQQGKTITNKAVTVANGGFTVQLDFTAVPFATGANSWIEIAVKKLADPEYTTLTPRQQLTSIPFATRSASAANADNASQLGGLAAKTYLQTNGDGSALTNLNGANITNNTITAAALDPDTFPNRKNLTLLSTLRWDLLVQRVPAGTGPYAVAFDGVNIWVANFNSDNVTKLRASDSEVQGTFAVGKGPRAVAFDGANIWVANSSSNNVTKLRASDGEVQGTFAVGTNPRGVAFDGANIWVANSSSSSVTKMQASDGAVLGTFPVSTGPSSLAFDGENIWLTLTQIGRVAKMRASDGTVLGTTLVGTFPVAIAFDGANVWVANSEGTVSKLRTSGGAASTSNVGNSLTVPNGVAFDGANIWVTNSGSNNVTKLRASDFALQGVFAVGAMPYGVAFDGANMWVANQGSNNVVKLPVFP